MSREQVTATISEAGGACTPLPRVNIGVAVYNGEEYLAETLDSLLGQTFGDFELIISDNASTDRTEAICRSYAAKDKRIRYYRVGENRGASWNFNRVFALARAEYFKWADHDDTYAPTFIARCVEVLDADPSIVCCHAKTRKIDARGNALPELPDPTDGLLNESPVASEDGHKPRLLDALSPKAARRFREVLLNSGWGVRCSGLFRVEALRRTSLFLPVFGYEKVIFAELALRGRFHDVPETLFYQRVHPRAMSTMASPTLRQRLFDPLGPRRAVLPRLRLLAGYLKAVHKAKLTPRRRLECYLAIVEYLLQIRKWRQVLVSTFRGNGTGGDNHKTLKQIDLLQAK